MQIMPSTGRELSRRLRLTPYSTSSLFQPQVNVRLGTYYLRTIANQVDGRWEAVLAAYNAGLSRAQQWSAWGEFREPSEFIETVPFTQTHDYIQIILRNADIYRRLYADSSGQLSYSSDDPAPQKAPAAAKAAAPKAAPRATPKKAQR
jgi:soluble lytic murein transglycosylase